MCPSSWGRQWIWKQTVLLLQWFRQKGTEFWSRMVTSVIMVGRWEVEWSKKRRDQDFKSSSNTVELLVPLTGRWEKWGKRCLWRKMRDWIILIMSPFKEAYSLKYLRKSESDLIKLVAPWLCALSHGFLRLIERSTDNKYQDQKSSIPCPQGVSSFEGIFFCAQAGPYVTECSTGSAHCYNMTEMKAPWNILKVWHGKTTCIALRTFL